MVEASAGLQRQEGLLFATRASGSLVALSPELQRLLGISAREGRRLADSLHPHDAAMASDWLDDLLSGRPVRPLRVRVRDLAGTYRMIEWDGLTIPHERLIVCSGREVGDPAPRVLSSGNGIELDVPTRIALAHDRSLDPDGVRVQSAAAARREARRGAGRRNDRARGVRVPDLGEPELPPGPRLAAEAEARAGGDRQRDLHRQRLRLRAPLAHPPRSAERECPHAPGFTADLEASLPRVRPHTLTGERPHNERADGLRICYE